MLIFIVYYNTCQKEIYFIFDKHFHNSISLCEGQQSKGCCFSVYPIKFLFASSYLISITYFLLVSNSHYDKKSKGTLPKRNIPFDLFILHTFKTSYRIRIISTFWSSPQTISNSQLHVLPHFHLCPIYLVLFKGFYSFKRMGYLILGGTSRLDAFSVYSFRTWLPGDAIGMTAGTPVVRPARSSRTKASSPQISYARAG